MKRALSLVLALVMLLTSFCVTSVYAVTKKNALDVLEDIQTTSGFIPGKTAAVTGNCYGFVSAVCEELYGVGYNGEGLYGNYMCRHETGNFYTVATYKNTSTSMSSTAAKDIKDFFVNNAMPGDIIHYGVITSGTSNSQTHTFMIQSVDNDKLRIYHANYETSDYSRASCHIDDIVWSSFLDSPTKNQYNSNGNMISLNAIFYNKMKYGGLGITINRYSKYFDYFNVVGPTIPNISLSRTTCNSIKVKWGSIAGATKYDVRYKKSTDSTYTSFSSSVKGTSCDVTGLAIGTKYNFKVRAYVGGSWMNYSKVVSLTTAPPCIKTFRAGLSKDGIELTWIPSDDATGYYIYRSESADDGYKKIKTISSASTESFVDKSVEYGKRYYYKVDVYKKVSSKIYTTTSVYRDAKYTLSKPSIAINRMSTTSLKFTITGDKLATKYNYVVKDSKGEIIDFGSTLEPIILKDLTINENYICEASSANAIGESDIASASKQALPPTPSYVKAENSSKGIVVSYPTRDDVTGYQIYRSTSADSDFSKIATVDKNTTSYYVDKDVRYGKKYFYKVRRYVVDSGKTYYGAFSSVDENGASISIPKIKDVKAQSTFNTTIKVSWSACEYATKYTVSYREAGEGSYVTLPSVTSTSLKIKGLKLGTYYEIRVRGENSFGAGKYDDPIKKRAIPPTMASPSLTATTSSVKLSWTPFDYCDGYRIYRKTSKSGTLTLYKTITSKTTKSFTDKSVAKGKTYYYSIQCYRIKNGKTYYSNKSPVTSIKLG